MAPQATSDRLKADVTQPEASPSPEIAQLSPKSGPQQMTDDPDGDQISIEAHNELHKIVEEEHQSIDDRALGEIASHHRGGMLCQVWPESVAGGYNLIYYILFEDKQVWVARLPLRARALRPLEDPLAQDAIESMVVTMRFLDERSSIPVPKVYAYDASCDNPLGRPYVLMSMIQGVNFSDVRDAACKSNPDAVHRIVRQWAACMVELATFQFDSIGSLHSSEGKHQVKTLISPYTLSLDRKHFKTVHCGPFHSVPDYLLSISSIKRLLDNPHRPSFGGHLRMSLVESLMTYFIDARYANGPFVLSHVDFSAQNILVDIEAGTITGILDWDWAAVLPLQSHFTHCDMFNIEFMPEGEYANHSPERNASDKEFCKRYRKVYEEGLVDAAKLRGLNWPIDDLLDRGLMFGLLEKALSYQPNEKYLPALWDHVYGGGLESQEKMRNEMRKSKWAASMAPRWEVDVQLRDSMTVGSKSKHGQSHYSDTTKASRVQERLSSVVATWKAGRDGWFEWVRSHRDVIVEMAKERTGRGIQGEREGRGNRR